VNTRLYPDEEISPIFAELRVADAVFHGSVLFAGVGSLEIRLIGDESQYRQLQQHEGQPLDLLMTGTGRPRVGRSKLSIPAMQAILKEVHHEPESETYKVKVSWDERSMFRLAHIAALSICTCGL